MTGLGWSIDVLLVVFALALVVIIGVLALCVDSGRSSRAEEAAPAPPFGGLVTASLTGEPPVIEPLELEPWQRDALLHYFQGDAHASAHVVLDEQGPTSWTLCDECGGVYPVDQLYAGAIRGVRAMLCESCCTTKARWMQ